MPLLLPPARQKPPPAVEARLCQDCADERFQSWQALVKCWCEMTELPPHPP